MNCMQRGGETSKCNKLKYDFEDCKKNEYDRVKKQFIESGILDNVGKIRKPDALRDYY